MALQRLAVQRSLWCLFGLLWAFSSGISAHRLVADDAKQPLQEMHGFRVHPDFLIEPFADDQLAHDIYCMTIDPQGRVVVAGPGYIRILIDEDQNGVADKAITFASEPRNGAQSLVYHGRDLLAVGDRGVLHFEDRDGDDIADGPAKVYLQIKTGGEHDAHSLQKGADGWWYLLAGNMARADSRYVTLKSSPITKPVHGVWMRIRPDMKAAEVLTDGLRNAYDFAFDQHGRAVTFDSDDERDISLPWYRPTRVLELTPTFHMGWESNSWKRPDDWLDSPRVLATAGRGSPTGVLCYQHDAFGESWRNTLFLLDWTYGRLLSISPHQVAATDKETRQAPQPPALILTAAPGFGFAPTDMEVGPDGSIYICVGGRGTQGGIYRLRPKQAVSLPQPDSALSPVDRSMHAILNAPQPLSSWSRARWIPLARMAGREALLAAALETSRSDAERIRAIEAITELYGGLKAVELLNLVPDAQASRPVVARAVWSVFRNGDLPPVEAIERVIPAIQQEPKSSAGRRESSLLEQSLLEGLLTIEASQISNPDWKEFSPIIISCLSHSDRLVRTLAARVVARVPEDLLPQIAGEAGKRGPKAAIAYAFGWIDRTDALPTRLESSAASVALKVLERSSDIEAQQEAIRLLQKILGGVGGPTDVPPAFLGYVAGANLSTVERQIDQFRVDLARIYLGRTSGNQVELERVLAMIELAHEPVLTKLLGQLSETSNPIDDIHVLAVSACMRVARTGSHREAIISAFLDLDRKIMAHKLPRDTYWNDRIRDIYLAHCAIDEMLPVVMAQHPKLGRSHHVLYLSKFPGELFGIALGGFVKQIETDPDYLWTGDVLFLLASANDPKLRELIRKQAQEFRLKSPATIALSEHPEEAERSLFVEGLASPQREVYTASIQALGQLTPATDAATQLALLATARRLNTDAQEYRLREQVIALLERNLQYIENSFVKGEAGFVPQTEALAAWERYLSRLYPEEMTRLANIGQAEQKALVDNWQIARTLTGDSQRGAIVFRNRTCQQCHSGAGLSTSSALGPNLAGAAKRFSRDDLLIAMIDPSRDVSSRYQATLIEHIDGRTLTGMIVYESTDGLLMRNATGQVFRVESKEIENRRPLTTSLMPVGLLNGVSAQDLADLEAYLQLTE